MRNTSVIKTFYALGTVNSIQVSGGVGSDAAKAAMARVKDISDKMSVFRKGSEVYELNRKAGWGFTEVSYDTINVLQRGMFYHRITGGAFDITSQPLTNLWSIGKNKRNIPRDEEIEYTLGLCGGGLKVDEYNLRASLRYEGQSVGLGAIAKGYAADEAARVLRSYGVENALVILGGNIWALGEKEDGGWRVGIQNPLANTGVPLGDIELKDETIVTSGSNEQFFMKDGTRYHHILDGRTGRPAQTGLLSVTVVGKNSMDMDALATSAFVLGMKEGSQLVTRMGAQAVFVDTSLNVYATSGLQGRLTLYETQSRAVSG